MCCECSKSKMNRREFLEISALGVAGASLISPSLSNANTMDWDPDKSLIKSGKKLIVQPILVYSIPQKRHQSSWRPWGALQTEAHINEEVQRITKELKSLKKKAGFPLQILPVEKVDTIEKAQQLGNSTAFDVPLVYAASGGTEMLESCFSENKNNLIFIRHRSGPIYLWYEILHNRFLRTGAEKFELDAYRNPMGMNINDVVVDEYDDLQIKLRSLFGIKNFVGHRIVALGGSGGWCCPEAPKLSEDKFKLDIQSVSYEDLAKRIKSAKADRKRVNKTKKWAEKYLSLPKTSLHTDKQFVFNGFLLYSIFNDYLSDYDTNAFTIKQCMGTVMPLSETTACLPLSLLNDEGKMAFCESDFNVIPSGLLLYYLSHKPVFLNDPTYPHHGIVTAAHCTAPRRMDGKNYALAKVVTHFESDYGATPKVELPIDSKITMICPDCSQKEWLGFTGSVEDNPFFDICRSQYDIKIDGNWKKLLSDHRGFHWMMACGNYVQEMEYACPKIGIEWKNISEV
jgi:hypothetical protein